MSEVSGKVVFRTTDSELASTIKNLSDDVTWEELHALLQIAEVDDLNDDDEAITVYVDGLFIEEKIFHDDLIILRVFGEAWLDVLQDLLESEKLELWSKLWHECGTDYYFASSQSELLYEEVDLEGDSHSKEDMDILEDAWRSMMPEQVQAIWQKVIIN
ncbi:MAG: hypothetical protein Q7S87_13125 [Agitococcus sp.]|jgi:hypothetical protein|nr:hypothetical protein [Agitococcus sp.]MDO9178199.1 hypothetical protein [Agitococcus sp.]